ncbi:MAG: helix-turn-helix domain-containing protein [Gaiellaceae bacterium]
MRCTESVAHELLAEAQRELVRLGERPMVYAAAEDTDRLLDVKDAASFVGCHPNTVYAAVKAGALKSHGYGRMRRFTRADLHAWTEAS